MYKIGATLFFGTRHRKWVYIGIATFFAIWLVLLVGSVVSIYVFCSGCRNKNRLICETRNNIFSYNIFGELIKK